MQQDRIKWNKKYTEKRPGQMVPGIVREYSHLAPSGRALDIACGTGAVSLYLAGKGFVVDAVDISDVALTTLSKQHPHVHTICADLDTFDLAASRYSLVANIRYLNRRLFPQILKTLLPGGMLIFETFLKSDKKEMDNGFKREYLLDEKELLQVFAPLDILYYREADSGCDETPARVASLVGIMP